MLKDVFDQAGLVIFDWDGTLIDSHDYIIDTMLMTAELSGLNIPSREAVSNIIGMSMAPAIASLFPELSEQQVLDFRKIYTDFYDDRQRSQPQLFANVKAFLEQLQKEKTVLAIATGKRKPGLMSGLQSTESEHYFSALRTADDCASKPSPEMVLSLLDELEFSPSDALVIGDNALDIKMAVAADVKALGVTTGSSSAEQMSKAGALACVSGISDFLDAMN